MLRYTGRVDKCSPDEVSPYLSHESHVNWKSLNSFEFRDDSDLAKPMESSALRRQWRIQDFGKGEAVMQPSGCDGVWSEEGRYPSRKKCIFFSLEIVHSGVF